MKKNPNKIREVVKTTYGNIARSDQDNSGCGCAPDCCSPSGGDSQTYHEVSSAMGYSEKELKNVPEGANLGLGCGNPQAIAAIKEGETVLDLGSGAGFDAFLAAKQVGDKGKIIGVDMTQAMISKATENGVKGKYHNVEFRLGEIEKLPVIDNSIDVIISNCVINLSPEKQSVFDESYRVLKKGGRLAISDIVAIAEMPDDIKNDMELYTGCISGASSIEELKTMLSKAGFTHVEIKSKEGSEEFILESELGSRIGDYIISATIEAIKP